MIVDTDDVLALFGASDRDIYAKGTIEDAIYDGTLKPAETERKTGRCRRCAHAVCESPYDGDDGWCLYALKEGEG